MGKNTHRFKALLITNITITTSQTAKSKSGFNIKETFNQIRRQFVHELMLAITAEAML